MQHGTHVLEKSTIEGLRDTIMLRRIRSGQPPFSALVLKEISKLMTSKLTPSIRPKGFDSRAMLSACPSGIRLVRVQGFVLSTKDFKSSETRIVVSKSNIISSTTQTVGR